MDNNIIIKLNEIISIPSWGILLVFMCGYITGILAEKADIRHEQNKIIYRERIKNKNIEESRLSNDKIINNIID